MTSANPAKKKLQKKLIRLEKKFAALKQRLDEWPDPATSEIFQALSQDRQEQAGRIGELDDAIRSLQENLSRQTNERTALAASVRELEAYAAELTRIRQEHEGRLTKLARDVASTQQQTARLEPALATITARTEALEEKNDEGGRGEDARSVRLQAAEGVVQTFREQLAELADRVSALQASQQLAQQQLTTVAADHEADRGNRDELRTGIERLEAQQVGQAAQVEEANQELAGLAKRLHELAALELGRRLDDQALRSDRLEWSQGEQQQRLAILETRDDALDEQLNSVTADSAALLGRIQKQDKAGEELRGQLQQLRTEWEASVDSARRQQAQLHDREVLLSERQKAVEEQANALAARQATQQSDTEDLQQRVRRRSLLGLLLLLLVAGLPLFLLLQPLLDADEPGPVEQLERTKALAEAEAAADRVALRQDVTELRADSARLGGSLNELEQLVDELKGDVDPDLPGQVAALSGAVAELAREGVDRQRQNTALLASQRQTDKQIRALAADLAGVQEQLARTDILETLAQVGKTRRWAKAQQLGRYTLQLMGAYRRESLARFVQRYAIEADSAIHVSEYRGKPWHVLLYGDFASINEARSAARQLPKALADQKPWVRQVPAGGDLFPL